LSKFSMTSLFQIRSRDSRARIDTVALSVFSAFRVLAAVEFDNQAPFAAGKVDVVSIDGLLADEFEAAELPAANMCRQSEFCGRECPPQRSRPLGALFILAPQRLKPSASGSPLTPALSPQAGRGSLPGRVHSIARSAFATRSTCQNSAA